MKTLFRLSFLVCLLAIFTSCGKDKCANTPPVEENIVGTWNAIVSFGGQTQSGEVIFNADKTGNSPGEVFQSEVNGQTVKDFTWKIEGDTLLFIKHTGSFVSNGYDIRGNECDNIKLWFFITEGNLYRK